MATLARTRGAAGGVSLPVALRLRSRPGTKVLVAVNLAATLVLLALDVFFHVF